MDTNQPYWHKQTVNKPLYENLIWSKPEHRATAGKLAIIGGNAQGFAAAGEAYSSAVKAGIGTARVLLPDSLRKTVGQVFDAAEYAPSTPSGSFSKRALAEVLDLALWADGLLVAGDLGRNSETAIVLEQLLTKYSGQLTITKDAADYFIAQPASLLARPQTTLIISFAQLQKLAINAHFTRAFTFDTGLLQLVDQLHEFSSLHQINIVTKHLENIFVAAQGQVSSTKLAHDKEIWRVATAAYASVWWLQNPSKSFEALTTAVVDGL